MSTPEPLKTNAQINPGIRYMTLEREWDLPSGISFTVDIINMRNEP